MSSDESNTPGAIIKKGEYGEITEMFSAPALFATVQRDGDQILGGLVLSRTGVTRGRCADGSMACKFSYGNRDTSGGIDLFWQNSSLRISADEQVEFLKAFYQERLPVAKRSLDIAKEIITLERTDSYKLSGRTGGGPLGERALGWFVGYLEKNGNVYFFALNIEGADFLAVRDERINLTKRILAGLGY
jgi:hypothetical protein